MTPLRQRMLEDMKIRNLSVNTQRSYLQQVSSFARYFQRSPETLGPEEIRIYQVHLTTERKLAPGACASSPRRCAFLKVAPRTVCATTSPFDLLPRPAPTPPPPTPPAYF